MSRNWITLDFRHSAPERQILACKKFRFCQLTFCGQDGHCDNLQLGIFVPQSPFRHLWVTLIEIDAKLEMVCLSHLLACISQNDYCEGFCLQCICFLLVHCFVGTRIWEPEDELRGTKAEPFYTIGRIRGYAFLAQLWTISGAVGCSLDVEMLSNTNNNLKRKGFFPMLSMNIWKQG